MRRLFGAILLLNLCDGERFSADGGEKLLSLLFLCELSLGGSEHRVAISSGEDPVSLGFKLFDFLLPVDDERERWRLYSSDAEHLMVLSVLQSIEAGCVHAEQPVADGAADTSQVQRLIIVLILQLLESLGNSLVGHRRDPQSFYWTFRSCFLHHPSLYELTLLSGVATVDDGVGSLKEFFDDGKLLFDMFLMDEFDAESLRNHGQSAERPWFPRLGIVVRFLQRTEMSVCPRDLISVAFDISVARSCSSDDACYFPCHAGFLCDTNDHQYPRFSPTMTTWCFPFGEFRSTWI